MILAVAGCAGPGGGWRIEVTPLGSADTQPGRPGAGQGRVVIETLPNAKVRAVVDGQPGPEFDDIRGSFNVGGWNRYGGDFVVPGGRISYAGRTGSKWSMVIDGKRGPESDRLPVSPVFTPDGRHSIYAVDIAGRQHVVIDGVLSPGYEHVEPWGFSPDDRPFYVARAKGKSRLVLDGRSGAESDAVGVPVFSADGRRVAYVGVEEVGQQRFERLVVDGNVGDRAGGSICEVLFSPDGRRLAYTVFRERLAEGNEQSGFVVLDGVAGETFEWVSDITFSPDSTRLAYVGGRGDRSTVVLDGRKDRLSWPQVGQICWCPGHNPFLFSADSRRLAYVAVSRLEPRHGFLPEHDLVIVVDGQAQDRWKAWPTHFDPIGLFSPDGRHFAFIAYGRRPGFLRVIVDGTEGPEFGSISGLRFLPDGSVEYQACPPKQSTCYRVRHIKRSPESRGHMPR